MNARDERPAGAKPLHLNVVGGKRVPAADDRTIDVVCPSDGNPFAAIARSGAADIDAAVKAARAAFDGAWGRLTATERGRLLLRLGEAVAARVDELGALESQDTGKPICQGRADIVATARYFEFYGSAADKVHGETIPFLNGYTVAVVRDPHGVTGHIVPWNYPAQIFGRSVGASLACGNACVVKPAEDAGLSLIRIAELALEVGFPEGALNVVSGLGEEAGAALASHPGIDFISFTGSPEVGTLIQAAAAKNHIGCTLELGGKSPQLVFADADLADAAPVLVRAIVQNGGQTCSAGSRLLVERRAYDDGRRRRRRALRRASRAGPHDRDLDLGAMVNAGQKRRVEGFVARARDAGVPVIAEGRVDADAPAGGYYVKPTLFGPVPRANDLAVRGGVRAGAVGHPVRGRGRRDPARQRHALRPRRRRLDRRRPALDAGRPRHALRPGLRQRLRRRRRHRAALRRRQALRPRPREGLRGAVRVLGLEDHRGEPRVRGR